MLLGSTSHSEFLRGETDQTPRQIVQKGPFCPSHCLFFPLLITRWNTVMAFFAQSEDIPRSLWGSVDGFSTDSSFGGWLT